VCGPLAAVITTRGTGARAGDRADAHVPVTSKLVRVTARARVSLQE
jgi:hypothetical protein